MAKPTRKTVPIDSIKRHPDFQMRVGGLDEDHARQIAQAIKDHAKVPPVKVAAVAEKDGELYAWDGHHELWGFELAGRKMVPVEVTEATWADTVRLAAGANKKNLALPRKSGDKRRAVEMLLKTFGRQYTNGVIAEIVGVSQEWVRQIRSEQPDLDATVATGDEPERLQGRGGRTYKRRPVRAGGVQGESWRDVPLDEFLDAPAKVFRAVEASKLKTAGEVYDAMSGGETFGLSPTDRGNLFASVVRLKDAQPAKPQAAPAGKKRAGAEVFPWRETNVCVARVARLPDDLVRAYPDLKGSESLKVLGRLLDEVVDAVKKLEKSLAKKHPGKE